jgi:hypothetical protein
MIKEHDRVVLTSELPSKGLLSGDVGTVVHIHGNASAYQVEFATLTGKTIAVATVLPSQCRPIGHRDSTTCTSCTLPDRATAKSRATVPKHMPHLSS